MFPEIFRIPGINLTLNTYGLLLAIGFMVGLMVMARLAVRDGLDKNRVYDLGLWVLAASLVGSKLLMVATDWEFYRTDWTQLFSLDFLRSGGVFYGGFIGALIASIIVMRRYSLPWWKTADAFAPGIVIGQAIGRLGCFSAGCCWGKPTTAACGVHFSEKGHEVTGVPTIVSHLPVGIQQEWEQRLGSLMSPVRLHPVQLYEVGACLVIFGILLFISGRRKFEGQVILIYLGLYAIARFIIEIWRDDPRGNVLNLSTSQFIAVVMFLIAVGGYLFRSRQTAA